MNQHTALASSKYRRPAGFWKILSVGFPLISMTLVISFIFHWRIFGIVLMDISYKYLWIASFLPLVFLWIPFTKKAPRQYIPWYDVLLIAISLIISLYLFLTSQKSIIQGWESGAPTLPCILSIILWGLMIEAGRRSAGSAFAAIILIFSVYPLIASHMPGFLWATNYSFRHVASFYALSQEGIAGLIMGVFGNVLFGYMVFAVVVQKLGAGVFFTNLAVNLVGKTRAGNAKVAIIASGLFASISGAAVANVMTTGSFTIPAMKEEGLPADFAGGVEAAASSAGALMPPVMGTVAFIMAEFIEVPYANICLGAAVPAILFYVCLFFQIDSYAARIRIKPPPIATQAPSILRTLLDNIHIIFGFITLVLILFFLRLGFQAPWIATAVALLLSLFRNRTRLSFKALISLFDDTGRVLGDLMGVLGPIGMIIGSFVLTGMAFSLPNEIVGLSGGNIALMLIFGAIASFILGMGVPISACYIFLAIVLAPGLVKGGFDLMATHLFIMYCGMMSNITPPVAMGAFAAASISGGSPMRTGVQAMKLGVAKYLLPFIFVTSPALILRAPIEEIVWVVPTAAIGLILISGGLEGYFWGMGNLTILSRILIFSAGLFLAIPKPNANIWGIAIFIAVFGLSYTLRGKISLTKYLVSFPSIQVEHKKTPE